MGNDASLSSLFWSLCQQTEITAVRGKKLLHLPQPYRDGVLCVFVCVCGGGGGCL